MADTFSTSGTHMDRLFFSLGIISFGLVMGYVVKRLVESGRLRLGIEILTLRKALQKAGLLFFMPLSFLCAVWVLKFSHAQLAFLPLLGLSGMLLGGLLAVGFSRLFGHTPRQTGTMFCCGSFSNIASIGGLVSFFFFGETGFAILFLYKALEEISYYTVGFPLAKHLSGQGGGQSGFGSRLAVIVRDPFVLVALSALGLGAVLNLTGVPRPGVFETINAVLVTVGTVALLASIGLALRFSSLGAYLRESLAASTIKFILIPSFVAICGWALGLHLVQDGLPFKVVLIAGSMPVAFTSLVAASLFDLDLDLANVCWLVTTCALALVLPWLYFLTGLV